MANKDLRNWLDGVAAIGEAAPVTGAEPKEEIGGIVDLFQRKMGNPAVLFDEVPGYPKGFRVLANILTSVPRINVALGLQPTPPRWTSSAGGATTCARRRRSSRSMVNGGPLLENVSAGAAVDITRIPTPVWHEHDGGPYIGTGCMVVMKDPDSGWVNCGTYRVQSHGPAVASVMISPGKHGLIIMEKYHARGAPCPVAVVVGMHPALLDDRRARNPLWQERI